MEFKTLDDLRQELLDYAEIACLPPIVVARDKTVYSLSQWIAWRRFFYAGKALHPVYCLTIGKDLIFRLAIKGSGLSWIVDFADTASTATEPDLSRDKQKIIVYQAEMILKTNNYRIEHDNDDRDINYRQCLNSISITQA